MHRRSYGDRWRNAAHKSRLVAHDARAAIGIVGSTIAIAIHPSSVTVSALE